MKSLIKYFAVCCLVAFAACTGKQEGNQEQQVPAEALIEMADADSLAVVDLINAFTNRIVNGNVEEAIASLRFVDPSNHQSVPQALNEEQAEGVNIMVGIFPVYSCEIGYIKYKYEQDNEARIVVHIANAAGEDSGRTTSWYFKPIRHEGQWMLCVKDSGAGDKPLE